MDQGYERKPLIESRGLVTPGDFARAAGLDRATVEALTRHGQLDGVADVNGRIVGLFTDVLPTSEHLRALGLAPRSDYAPDDLRGTEEDSDDEDEHGPDDGSPTWTMGWPDGAQGEPRGSC